MKKPKIGFIGAGTVGTALAVRLQEKGYPIVAVASRTQTSAERLAERLGDNNLACGSLQKVADKAELVFLTTSDDAIGLVARAVNWHLVQYVVHCSGADSLSLLEPAMKAGAQAGSFHPLQTFAEVNYAIANLPGSNFALEADKPLLSILKEMAMALDGQWIELKPGDKVIYHTAAVFACNYLVTLVKLATDLWQSFGVAPPRSTQALLPLLQGTINNLSNVGLPNCLTGPIARGDLGTIEKHLEALKIKAPQMLKTYQELGKQTIPIALAKGKLDAEKAAEMKKLFVGTEI
jgi:predicted short-subunit dehydrogenase-like oxidoreductase (DUF2520 family)